MKSTKVAAILAFLLVSAITAVNANVQGSVTLFKLVGNPITADCFGPNAHHGPVNLGVEESHMWQFPISLLSKGWTCHFEWIDNASCVIGRRCDIHKQDVKMWEGILGTRRKLLIKLTPCNDYLWQIKADGSTEPTSRTMCTPSFSPGTRNHITLRRLCISEGISHELIHAVQLCSSLCRRGLEHVVYF